MELKSPTQKARIDSGTAPFLEQQQRITNPQADADQPSLTKVDSKEEVKKREPYWHPVFGDNPPKVQQEEQRFDATHTDILVPIRLDVEVDGCRLVDTFLWNLNEADLSPEQFSTQMCVDLELVPRFEQAIANAIRSQLAAYLPQTPPLCCNGGEMLIPILIDLRFKSLHLRDRIEWDLCNESMTPEDFARTTCYDLGLPGDFEPAIALHIREQLSDYKAAMSGKKVQALVDPTIVSIVEEAAGPQHQNESPQKKRKLTVKRMPAVHPGSVLRSKEEAEEWGPKVSLVPASAQLQLYEALWQRYCPQPSEAQMARYPSVKSK